MSKNILRIRKVLEKTGESRSTFYAGIREGRWPKPIKLGPRSSGWLEAEIDAAIDARIAERDGQITKAA